VNWDSVRRDCQELFAEYILCTEVWKCTPSQLAVEDFRTAQEHLILFDALKKREQRELKEAEAKARHGGR